MNEYELLTVANEGGNAVLRRRSADALFPERAAANAVLRTVTGDPASFSDGAEGRALPKAEAKIETAQDLNGYDFPWAPASRNLVDPEAVTQDGADTVWIFRNAPYPFWQRLYYRLSLRGIAFDELAFLAEDGETVLASVAGGGSVDSLRWRPEVTEDADHLTRGMIRIRGTGIPAADAAAHCLLVADGTGSKSKQPLDWVPCENVCPVSGRTSVSVTHNEERIDAVFPEEAGMVCGGVLDLTEGLLTVTEAAVTRTLAGHGVSVPFAKIASILYYPEKRQLTIKMCYILPKGYRFAEAGSVAASGEYYDPQRDGELTEHLDSDPEGYFTRMWNPDLHENKSSCRTQAYFTWNKTDADPGAVWYIRPYCKYTDGTDTYLIYGEQRKAVAGEEYDVNPRTPFSSAYYSDYCRDYLIEDLPFSFKAGGAQRSSLLRYAREYSNANFFMDGTTLYAALPDAAADKLENQPIVFCGELEEPLRFRLTPRQIKAIAGENRMSADCGPVTVTYIADTETVIGAGLAADRAMVAAEAPDSTAARTYEAGDYLTVGETLYRVTAAIAEGETITPGGNVTATTVGEQLTALFNLINS